MDRTAALHLLQAMIDYFEAGNRQSDGTAKTIIESDVEHPDYWQQEMQRLKAAGEWTGLRAPEADIVAGALRTLKKIMEE